MNSPDLDHLASDLVVAAARLVRAARRAVDQPTGVRVLSLLDEYDALSITQLADLDRSSQPSMSGTVAVLLSNGWVTKQPDPDDARRSLIRLAAAGRTALEDFRRDVGHTVAERFRALGTHDATDLEHAIGVLRGVLEPDAVVTTAPPTTNLATPTKTSTKTSTKKGIL